MNTTGKILKKLRKEKKYTMDQLAEILNEKYNLNINKSMISKWENGSVSISNTNANAYCKFFNVTLDYLIYGTDKSKAISLNNQTEDNIVEKYKLTPEELAEFEKVMSINSALMFNGKEIPEENRIELEQTLKKIFIRSLLIKRAKESDVNDKKNS